MTNERRIAILIFIFAMALRMALGFVNRYANDNHIDVVNFIVDKHVLPEKSDCWSCYQPKLYYLICAAVVGLFQIPGDSARIIVMQMVNVAISFFILLLFWKFIKKQELKPQMRLITFAFFAFNPCLAGINIQGTNDTLVIFLGILFVYVADLFFKQPKMNLAVMLAMALIAGALTKASAIVLAGVSIVLFAFKILFAPSREARSGAVKYFSIVMITFLAFVPVGGGYYHNYAKYGSLTLSTWDADPKPFFFETTPVTQPGLLNMFSCFFTFRYFDMIRQPYINSDPGNFPLHRTSLWSQLYGRTFFMHFDQWPPPWYSHAPFIVLVGRVLLALGIVPLFLFISGLIQGVFRFIKNMIKRNRSWFAAPQNYLHVVVTLAFLCSSLFYTYNFRAFSSMKSIYIFPGLLSFMKLWLDGFAMLKSKVAIAVVQVVLIIMIVFSIEDILFLLVQLV